MEIVCACAVLVVAVVMRLVNLDLYSGDVDEGIRGAQLSLMAAGFRPFQEIHASQGPLLLDLLYPVYSLFGGMLPGLRLAVGLYSLVAVAGTYWVGRQLAGPTGALAASILLVLSPTYLRYSRLGVAETIALGPAVLAFGAALRYQRDGRRAWLLAAGALLGLSLAIKPITIVATLPVALAILLRTGRSWRDLAVLVAVAGGLLGMASVLVGLPALIEKIVEYRVHILGLQNWRLQDNWAILRGALSREQLPIYGLAALGGIVLLRVSPRGGGPVVIWAIGAVVLLLFYSPLFLKHASTIIPPLAVLAGAGMARLGVASGKWEGGSGKGSPRGRALASGLLLGGLAWYASSAPALFGWDLRYMGVGSGDDAERYSEVDDAVRSIAAVTGPGEFVLTDHPYLPFMAARLVPPPLADTAETRVRSRDLTGEEVVAAATRYPTPVAVLWTDRFRSMRAFRSWLEERFQVAKVYARKGDPPRFIYLARGPHQERARAAMTADLVRAPRATFAGRLRLAGYALQRSSLSPRDTTALTLEWEALSAISADYHVLLKLLGPDGQVWDDEDFSLLSEFGRGDSPAGWAAGRWLIQVSTIAIPADAPAGQYWLIVEVHDPKGGGSVPADLEGVDPTSPEGDGVAVATLAVD